MNKVVEQEGHNAYKDKEPAKSKHSIPFLIRQSQDDSLMTDGDIFSIEKNVRGTCRKGQHKEKTPKPIVGSFTLMRTDILGNRIQSSRYAPDSQVHYGRRKDNPRGKEYVRFNLTHTQTTGANMKGSRVEHQQES